MPPKAELALASSFVLPLSHDNVCFLVQILSNYIVSLILDVNSHLCNESKSDELQIS